MKRSRRRNLRRGNMTGEQRRRALRIVRELERDPYPPACLYIDPRHAQCRLRDARRLAEAGLVTAAIAKREWGVGRIKELAVFLDPAEARRRYPWTILPGRHR